MKSPVSAICIFGLMMMGVVLGHGQTSSSSSETVALAVLTNIKDNGFNSDPKINDGLGGLWVNWRTGTNPLQVNFNGSGSPDGDKIQPPRHDDLTDLRYLHALFFWKHQHPQDTQFDGDIARYGTIVKHEFTNTHNERGWIYDELIDMTRLSGDPFFRDTARSLAGYYASKEFHSDIGAIYKTNASHPDGQYRVDEELETGCALVQAGTEFNQPDFSAKGERLVNFIYSHAYLANYHIFLTQMDEVKLADGSANANEKIFREPFRNYVADGGVVRFGGIGQIALSLLHTYIVTQNEAYLKHANDLLEPLTEKQNLLGVWDDKDGGYFDGVEFPGTDFQNPGEPKLLNGKKESGRQFQMLQAFHVADSLTGGQYQTMENAMLHVLLDKAYYAPGRGMLYEMKPDWTPLPLHGKKDVVEDWVTTEAMGCSLIALLSLNEKEPW